MLNYVMTDVVLVYSIWLHQVLLEKAVLLEHTGTQ